MADNVQKLKDAGSLPEDAKLDEAETAVINDLSEEEVQMLIGIRKKLDAERARRGTDAVLGGPEEGGVSPSAGFIV